MSVFRCLFKKPNLLTSSCSVLLNNPGNKSYLFNFNGTKLSTPQFNKKTPIIRLMSTNNNDDDDDDDDEEVKKTPEFKKLLDEIYKDFEIKLPTEDYQKSNVKSPSEKISTPSIESEFEALSEENSEVIYDLDEEKIILKEAFQQGIDDPFTRPKVKDKTYDSINLNRGEDGVFDVLELVQLLRKENGKHVLAIKIDPSLDLYDHMVICSCKSKRHLKSVASFVKKAFKLKMDYERDTVPKLEGGEHNTAWIAMDLGNIALHLFIPSQRAKLDLETLWVLGSEFDKKEEDELANELMDSYSELLGDIKPRS